MQRTILVSNGGGSNTYGLSATGTVVYYGPISGGGPVGWGQTSTVGTGAYGRSQFACVLSKLYLSVGKIYTQNAAIQSQINVNGPSPTAGNLNATSGAQGQTNNDHYYYDATDIDAISAGQLIGYMETLNGVSGADICAPCRGVICDTFDQGFCTPTSFGNAPIFNSLPRYSSFTAVGGLTATITNAQHFASMGFVASGLNWQTVAGNVTTSSNATCNFAHNSNFGTSTNTSLAATIQSAGFVGLQYDATDIAAVPAGDYYGLNWTGTNIGNSLGIATNAVHIQAAGNSCVMLSGGGASTWTGNNPTYSPFNQGARYDYLWYENVSVVATSGVFSNLYVYSNTNTYASATSFTVLNGPTTGDTGAGSGGLPGSGAGNPTPPGAPNIGFNATGVQAVLPASTTGWVYDATDIAAFVGGTNMLVVETYATGGGGTAPSPAPQLQASSINFTAPAHRGLTTQGAG